MGIRLYPNTQDATVLERLAGVPSGTMRLLHLHREMVKVYMEFKALTYDDNGNDVEYDIYCLFKGTPVDKLDNFLLNGWGKFDYSLLPAEMQEEEEWGQLPSGEQAAQLLLSADEAMPHWDLQDALQVVAECGGVNWG
jgi:hypothetical protein